MSTNTSKTTVYDSLGRPLVCFFKSFDGEFSAFGMLLADRLKETITVNGMGSLASQLVQKFSSLSLVAPSTEANYDYEIRPVSGRRVSLIGRSLFHRHEFDLYGDIDTKADIISLVTFVYDKGTRDALKWRTIAVTSDTDTYLEGYDTEDGDKFKRFLKSKIFGGKIVVLAKGK